MGVWMHHPDLPGQPIQVAATAVPTHRRSGWRTFTDDNKQPPKPEVEETNLTSEDLEFVPPEALAPSPDDEEHEHLTQQSKHSASE